MANNRRIDNLSLIFCILFIDLIVFVFNFNAKVKNEPYSDVTIRLKGVLLSGALMISKIVRQTIFGYSL